MSEDRNSCPRCADYDRVVEEVENLKSKERKRSRVFLMTASKLVRNSRKPTVTTMTVVAAVTGADFVKEFVDKVADYIDSFNNATGLNLPTSKWVCRQHQQHSPPQPPQQQDKQDEKKEEEKDEEDKG